MHIGLLFIGLAVGALAKHKPLPHHSQAFRLVVKAIHARKDFIPTIQNSYVTSFRTPGGDSLLTLTEDVGLARIFYQNGTLEEKRFNLTSIATDSVYPLRPTGLRLVPYQGSNTLRTAWLKDGAGETGLGIAVDQKYPFVSPETWVACMEKSREYKIEEFIVLRHATTTWEEDGALNKNIPKDCIGVRLVPLCSDLPPLWKQTLSIPRLALNTWCHQGLMGPGWKGGV